MAPAAQRPVHVATADGRMEAFAAHPKAGGPFPAVLLYMDVWGVREELFAIARRIAAEGYYCIVPDLYYRQGRIRSAFRDGDGRMISLDRLDPPDRRAALAPLELLSDAMAMDDTAALLDFLDAGEPARPGAMGSIGYCLGGRLALRAAARFPDRFRASASLHGTGLVSDRDDSPHLSAGSFRGELYCGFGARDPYTPPSLVRRLAGAMASGPARYRFTVHEGAKHGYALPERDVYDARAAAVDREIVLAMYRRRLSP